MTWNPQDSIREDIVGLPAPPTKVADLFEHAAWADIFDSWATDYGSGSGDQTPSQLFELCMQLRYSTDWKVIRDKFVVSGNPCGLDWPANVTDGFDRLDAGVDDSSTPAEVELFNAAEQKIDRYLTTFLADIHDIQSGKVGDASAAASTAQNPKPHVDWMDDNELDNLLGNARPKTLQEIENDPYWWTIFGKWVYWLDYHGQPGIRAKYDAWDKDRNGRPREVLKKAGNRGDLRQEFYDMVGKVKDDMREWEKG